MERAHHQPYRALLGAFAIVLAFGAAQAVYGPALPAFRQSFDVGGASAGLLLSAHFTGSLAGIVLWGAFEGRFSPRPLLVVSAAAVAVGALTVGGAPAWPAALAGAGLIGAGAGGLDVGLNTVVARGYGTHSPAVLSVMHAMFGVGAILGPAAVALQPDSGFRLPLLLCAALGAGAVPLMAVFHAEPPVPVRNAPVAEPGRRLPPALWGFVALFGLYVAVEAGIGGWMATFLMSQGRSESYGAAATSVFWAAFTVGRFVAAPIALRVAPGRMVVLALAGCGGALLFTPSAALAPAAFAAAGLFLAPVFPSGIAWLARELPGVRGATAIVIGGSAVGGVIAPPAIGAVMEATGEGVFPLLLAGGLLGAVGAALALRRMKRVAAPRRGVGDSGPAG